MRTITMDSYTSEKLLSICYPLIVAFAFICSVTTAVAYNHWKYVLDTCVPTTQTNYYDNWKTNCGCILNGMSTPTYFTGGHASYCHWTMYGLILPIIFCLIFGSYHLFRVCMTKGKTRTGTTTVKQRSGEVIVMTTRTELTEDTVSPYYWIPASSISVIMAIYTIVHASIYTDGFLRSCKQYRYELTKYMQATGNLVGAIQGRISCASVFDFMDYIHPDASFDRRRDSKINTAACLIIGIITAWLCVFLWIFISYINIKQAKESRKVRI